MGLPCAPLIPGASFLPGIVLLQLHASQLALVRPCSRLGVIRSESVLQQPEAANYDVGAACHH